MNKLISFCLVFILSLVVYTKSIPQCILHTEKGTINLNYMANEKYWHKKDYDVDYYVNICGAAKKECHGSENYPSIEIDKGTCNYLGDLKDTTLKETSNGVELIYGSGQKQTDPYTGTYTRKTSIKIKCNKELPLSTKGTNFVFKTSDMKKEGSDTFLYFYFEMESPYACPGVSGGAEFCNFWNPLCSIGFLITVFVLPVIIVGYIVIGLIVCKFVLKKEGLEIIPNFNFWKSFPFILKDGVLFYIHLHLTVLSFILKKISSIEKLAPITSKIQGILPSKYQQL